MCRGLLVVVIGDRNARGDEEINWVASACAGPLVEYISPWQDDIMVGAWTP